MPCQPARIARGGGPPVPKRLVEGRPVIEIAEKKEGSSGRCDSQEQQTEHEFDVQQSSKPLRAPPHFKDFNDLIRSKQLL